MVVLLLQVFLVVLEGCYFLQVLLQVDDLLLQSRCPLLVLFLDQYQFFLQFVYLPVFFFDQRGQLVLRVLCSVLELPVLVLKVQDD